jgi:hypothetical protein
MFRGKMKAACSSGTLLYSYRVKTSNPTQYIGPVALFNVVFLGYTLCTASNINNELQRLEFMDYMKFSEQTPVISSNSINQLTFVIMKCCVFFG